MPRDGTQTYVLPFPDVAASTTIESTVYNGFTNDVAQDLNTPRPIKFGGTGAVDAATARFNLATEIAAQVVTNYDSHLWVPGSFYSATTATGEPVDGHAFSGVAYIGEALANPPTNQNVTLEARDTSDGKLYIRRKTAGVWGAWIVDTAVADAKVAKAGDTMTGALLMPDGTVTAPAIGFSAETTTGMWRVATNQIGWTVGGVTRLTLSNTALTSTLPVALPADPTTALQAATKQYVDARDNAIVAHGQCKLVMTSSTVLTLIPFNGNAIKINGVVYTLPAAGITWSGATTNATMYYVYASWTGSSVALSLSGVGHSRSSTAGNIGVEIKTGDDTFTLVGMVRAGGTSGQWLDSNTARLVRSWFNESGITGTNDFWQYYNYNFYIRCRRCHHASLGVGLGG